MAQAAERTPLVRPPPQSPVNFVAAVIIASAAISVSFALTGTTITETVVSLRRSVPPDQRPIPVPPPTSSAVDVLTGLEPATTAVVTVAAVVGAGLLLRLLGWATAPAPEPVTYAIPDSADLAKGLGEVRRTAYLKDRLLAAMADGVATCYEAMQAGARKNPNGPCFGTRRITGANPKGQPIAGEYVWQTYTEVNSRIADFGSGLLALGLIPEVPGIKETGPLRLLGLFMKNRAEWVIAEHGCFRQGASTVPMYDTLGPDTVEMIFNETQLTTVVTNAASVPTLLTCRDLCPSFRNVVYVDELSADVRAKAQQAGLALYSFAEVEAKGKAAPAPATPPRPDSLATFCYTSGTTGKSKGALLAHRNLVAVAAGVEAAGIHLTSADRHLSYLPLAHVFERAAMLLVMGAGAKIGFFQGETVRIPDDLATLRHTFFPTVPRLINRFYDKVMAGVQQQGGLKAVLFRRGYAAKQRGLANGRVSHALWDKLVFSKITKKLGLDQCRVVAIGSAPVAPHVIEFMRIMLSCPVMEGYGQTECAGVATGQGMYDYSTGNVGAPFACCEVRLVSVPDMGYLITDRRHGMDEKTGNPGIPCLGRGEIWVRGPNAFLGYYKMPEATAEAMDSDGWVHSGDIGIWTARGQLKVVDRKKNIFKLAQGEYIAPEKIENVYCKSSIVSQAFVYGDSFQHQL
eukprot:EG_transcript_5509